MKTLVDTMLSTSLSIGVQFLQLLVVGLVIVAGFKLQETCTLATIGGPWNV